MPGHASHGLYHSRGAAPQNSRPAGRDAARRSRVPGRPATPGLVFTTPPTEPPLDRPEGRPRGVAPPVEVLGSGRDSDLRPRSLRASVGRVESRSAQLFVLLRRGETGGGACGVGVAFRATRFIVPFCHVN